MKQIKKLKIYIKGDVDGEVKDTIKRSLTSTSSLIDEDTSVKALEEGNVENVTNKNEADIHLYCITPLYNGIDIYAEIIDSCYTNPNGVIVFVNRIQYGYQFTEENKNNIKKIVTRVNELTGRVACVLNSTLDLIDMISEITSDEVKRNKETRVSGIVNQIYEDLKVKLPSRIFDSQTPIENIRRILFDYVVRYGDNSKGTT